MEIFSQKLHLLQGSNLLEAAADGISQLNPIPHLKTIGGSMAGFMLISYVFFSVSTKSGSESPRKSMDDNSN